MINFHVLKKNNLMLDEYTQEMTLAQQEKDAIMKTGGNINETNVAALTSPEDISAGKDIFTKNCVNCHGNGGEGTVGPNLTDDYWIHGNTIQDMFNTVTNGVLEKGMISYKDQYSPQQRLEVLSYIITLHGTKPANPKAPQGEMKEWPY